LQRIQENFRNSLKKFLHIMLLFSAEVLVYYLSLILGFDNVPPVKLIVFNHSDPLWRDFPRITEDGKVISLSIWIKHSKSVLII
jgi:hypothetical protein